MAAGPAAFGQRYGVPAGVPGAMGSPQYANMRHPGQQQQLAHQQQQAQQQQQLQAPRGVVLGAAAPRAAMMPQAHAQQHPQHPQQQFYQQNVPNRLAYGSYVTANDAGQPVHSSPGPPAHLVRPIAGPSVAGQPGHVRVMPSQVHQNPNVVHAGMVAHQQNPTSNGIVRQRHASAMVVDPATGQPIPLTAASAGAVGPGGAAYYTVSAQGQAGGLARQVPIPIAPRPQMAQQHPQMQQQRPEMGYRTVSQGNIHHPQLQPVSVSGLPPSVSAHLPPTPRHPIRRESMPVHAQNSQQQPQQSYMHQQNQQQQPHPQNQQQSKAQRQLSAPVPTPGPASSPVRPVQNAEHPQPPPSASHTQTTHPVTPKILSEARQGPSPQPMTVELEMQNQLEADSSTTIQPSPLGIAVLRLLQLGPALSAALKVGNYEAIQSWVEEFYLPNSFIRFDLADADAGANIYCIPTAALARFYDVLRESGVRSFQLVLDAPKEFTMRSRGVNSPVSGYVVQCDSIACILTYENGTSIMSKGMLRATFVPQPRVVAGGPVPPMKMDFMEYAFISSEDLVSRSAIVKKAPDSTTSASQGKEENSPHTPYGNSDVSRTGPAPARPNKRAHAGDEASANSGQGPRKKPSLEVKIHDFAAKTVYEEMSLPPVADGSHGVNDRAMRILEIAEFMDHLGELVSFSNMHDMGPREALERYASLCLHTGVATAEVAFAAYDPKQQVQPAPPEQDQSRVAAPQVNGFAHQPSSNNGPPALSSLQIGNSMSNSFGAPPSAPLPQTANPFPLTNGASTSSHSAPGSPQMALDLDSSFDFRLPAAIFGNTDFS